MLYFQFLAWLISKTDKFATKHSAMSDTRMYNRFYENPVVYGIPFAGLFRLIILFIFIGLPMVGWIYLVAALPVSPTAQWLILVASALLVFVLVARILLKSVKR